MAINLFEDYSMTWKPDIINSNKPIYITIADQLENDIKTGILSPALKPHCCTHFPAILISGK